MKKQYVDPRLFSVNELAQYLGISPVSIYKGISRKAKKKFPIKPKRLGGLVKFDKKDVDKYIDKI